MTVLIILTIADTDTGPFDLYSNLDYTTPFETNVNKVALQTGYTTSLVPDLATIIRVVSTGNCINYVDIPLTSITSSTSSTSTSSSSSTTTSTTIPAFVTTTMSIGHSFPLDACADLNDTVISIKLRNLLVQAGDTVYNLLGLPFPGGGNFFHLLGQDVAQIDGSGVITSIFLC